MLFGLGISTTFVSYYTPPSKSQNFSWSTLSFDFYRQHPKDGGRYCFCRCVSVHRGVGGTPWSLVPGPFPGLWYPVLSLVLHKVLSWVPGHGGTPRTGQWVGTPRQDRGSLRQDRVPPDKDRGTPRQDRGNAQDRTRGTPRTGQGYLPDRTGVPSTLWDRTGGTNLAPPQDRTGYPDPPLHRTRTVVRRGRYDSCVQAGGLSCWILGPYNTPTKNGTSHGEL